MEIKDKIIIATLPPEESEEREKTKKWLDCLHSDSEYNKLLEIKRKLYNSFHETYYILCRSRSEKTINALDKSEKLYQESINLLNELLDERVNKRSEIFERGNNAI